MIERRREQLDQSVATADQLSIDRRHGSPGTCRVAAAGDHRPRLRDGVDAALLIEDRTKRRSIIVIAASIPVAVPRFALDGLLNGERMPTPPRGAVGGTPPVRDGRKLQQRRMEEPTEPYALAAACSTDTVHAVVPIAAAEQRQTMGTDSKARVQRQTAVLEE